MIQLWKVKFNPVFISAVSGCVSISEFASLVGVPVGIQVLL